MRWFMTCLLAAALAFGCAKKEDTVQTPAGPASPQEPQKLAEAEPNDTAITGLLVKSDARVTGEISAAGKRADEDFYRLEARGEDKIVDLAVEGAPGLDLGLELLDQDGNHLAVFNSEGEGKGEKIPRLGLASPVAVKVFAANKGGSGSYVAQVRFGDAPADGEREPNERAIDATPLVLAKSIQGWIGAQADEDWFRFEVPIPPPASPQGETGRAPPPEPPRDAAASPGPPSDEGSEAPWGYPAQQAAQAPAPAADAGAAADASAQPAEGQPGVEPNEPAPARPVLVKIDLTPVAGVRLQVDLSNEAQAVFFSARSREEGEGVQVRNVALRPGETTFFVTVKSAWSGTGKSARRGYSPEAPYTLTVTEESVAGDAELESNDEPAKATPFSPTGSMLGYFSPKGDVDYFALRYEQPTLLKIELSGVDRVDSTLSLVRVAEGEPEKEETLVRANDGAVREGERLVNVAAAPGEALLLKVEPAARQVQGKWVRDQENPAEPYTLVVSARPDEGLDEREPNDGAGSATPIEFGKPLRGLVHPKRDRDFFRFDLSGSPVKVPIKATATGILKVDVSLALHRLGEDGKPALIQTAEKGKGEQPETIRFTVDPGVYLLEVKDSKDRNSNFLDSYQLLLEREQ